MVEYQRRIIHGTYERYNSSGLSGSYPPIQVCSSGELVICSGIHVVADIAESGMHVQISGQHVYVESGVYVVADVEVEVSSGLFVDGVSGVHVYVESGVHVSISGQPVAIVDPGAISVSGDIVQISGQHVFVESGVYLASGIRVLTTVDMSGTPVTISGDHVYVESGVWIASGLSIGVMPWPAMSGVGVQIQSGAGVLISGQHVYVESGVYLASGLHVVSASGGTVHAIIDGTVAGTAFQITDRSGHISLVGQRHGGLVTTHDAISEVHHGGMYHVSYVRSGMDNGNNLDMFFMTGSGREVHANFGMGCGGEFEGCLFENVTATDSGTPITANNMNRFYSGQPGTVFSIDPTITSTYTCLWHTAGGTGGKSEASPGEANTETAWILNGVSGRVQYLLRLTNKAGAAKDAFVSMSFTEEDPVVWW